MQLSGVYEENAAIYWQLRLEKWWQAFGHLTTERNRYHAPLPHWRA